MNTQSKSATWDQDRNHLLHPYTRFFRLVHDEGSQVISSASGMHVFDDKGDKYLDGIAGLWLREHRSRPQGDGRGDRGSGSEDAVLQPLRSFHE